MKGWIAVVAVLVLTVPAWGGWMEEIGVQLDLGPLPPVGNEPFEWMSTISFYGEAPLPGGYHLGFTVGTPFDRWIFQLSFRLTKPIDAFFATEALLSTAGIPDGARGAQLDLGLRGTPIDHRIAQFSMATYPLGLQALKQGSDWEWGLYLGLNLTADARVILRDTLTLGLGTRIVLLETHPVGEPILPPDETFGTFTRGTVRLGYRPHG